MAMSRQAARFVVHVPRRTGRSCCWRPTRRAAWPEQRSRQMGGPSCNLQQD